MQTWYVLDFTVAIPYLKGFLEVFKRIASKHGVKSAFRPGTKVKELKSKARTPLGEKKANFAYSIPFECKNNIYLEKELKAKVYLSKKDLQEGKIESA